MAHRERRTGGKKRRQQLTQIFSRASRVFPEDSGPAAAACMGGVEVVRPRSEWRVRDALTLRVGRGGDTHARTTLSLHWASAPRSVSFMKATSSFVTLSTAAGCAMAVRLRGSSAR